MKINLDMQISLELREKVYGPFYCQHGMRCSFPYPSTRKGKHEKEINTDNCIHSAVDRISEFARHCNTLDLSDSNPSKLFAFYDFLNYSQTLIECITILGRIFGVQYHNPSAENSCFRFVRKSNKGNDDRYFKYLRSLCAIHPVQTNNHPEYQDEEPEWCPYITSRHSGAFALFDTSIRDADFVAVVYRNDVQFSKYIPIYVEELFSYVRKRYALLNEIIEAAENYYDNFTMNLRNKHIPTPDERENYLAYLCELETAMLERCGDAYAVRKWKAIMQTQYEDELMQSLLVSYQRDLKYFIQTVHAHLQQIDYEDTANSGVTRPLAR